MYYPLNHAIKKYIIIVALNNSAGSDSIQMSLVREELKLIKYIYIM